jgi:hypothetical protein
VLCVTIASYREKDKSALTDQLGRSRPAIKSEGSMKSEKPSNRLALLRRLYQNHADLTPSLPYRRKVWEESVAFPIAANWLEEMQVSLQTGTRPWA